MLNITACCYVPSQMLKQAWRPVSLKNKGSCRNREKVSAAKSTLFEDYFYSYHKRVLFNLQTWDEISLIGNCIILHNAFLHYIFLHAYHDTKHFTHAALSAQSHALSVHLSQCLCTSSHMLGIW